MGFRLFRLTPDEIDSATFTIEDTEPTLAGRLNADWKDIQPCSRDHTIQAYGILVENDQVELAKKIKESNLEYERTKRPKDI